MCNPAVVPYVIAAAGAVASYQGQKKSNQAVADAAAAERRRQKGYQQTAETAFNRSEQAFSPEEVDADIGASTQARTNEYNAQNLAAPRSAEQAASGSMGGNKTVQEANARTLGSALNQAGQIGDARAKMSGFADMLFNKELDNNRNRDGINMAINFARSSANTAGPEMQQAGQAGAGLASLGQLLAIAGQAAGSYYGAQSANNVPSMNMGQVQQMPAYQGSFINGNMS